MSQFQLSCHGKNWVVGSVYLQMSSNRDILNLLIKLRPDLSNYNNNFQQEICEASNLTICLADKEKLNTTGYSEFLGFTF